MKILRGQPLREDTYSNVVEQLEVIFYRIVFKPIVDLLAPHNAQVRVAAKEMRNAVVAPVVAAIRAGKIQHSEGTFSGDFSATTSKALRSYGADWNKVQKTFTIEESALPIEVLAAVNEYAGAAKDLHDELAKRLDEIQRGLESAVDSNTVDAKVVVGKMEKGFNKTYGEAVGREELSDRASESLSDNYTDNMKLWIKKWCAETITDLRGIVEVNAKEGYRFDRLIPRIQGRYDVSKTKASFLARQETALLVSKHRQERFADVGITSYIWRTAGDADVRDDHKKLNGREFEYANPPIVDEATGRRANAGEDFNCRCVAEPVMPGVLA